MESNIILARARRLRIYWCWWWCFSVWLPMWDGQLLASLTLTTSSRSCRRSPLVSWGTATPCEYDESGILRCTMCQKSGIVHQCGCKSCSVLVRIWSFPLGHRLWRGKWSICLLLERHHRGNNYTGGHTVHLQYQSSEGCLCDLFAKCSQDVPRGTWHSCWKWSHTGSMFSPGNPSAKWYNCTVVVLQQQKALAGCKGSTWLRFSTSDLIFSIPFYFAHSHYHTTTTL